MDRVCQTAAGTRGGAPEALCDVLARAIALLVPERPADGAADTSRDGAAVSGSEREGAE